MKTAKCIILVVCALSLLGVGLAGAQDMNYSGTWALDKAKSTLSGRMNESLMNITLVIMQKADDFNADFQYKYSEREMADKIALKIGGEQVERDVMGGRGKAKSQVRWSDDKKNLILVSDRTVNTDNGTFSSKMTDTYSLSADGKTLTINSNSESSRGSRTSTMVFTKQ